jgi:hypothetical protein
MRIESIAGIARRDKIECKEEREFYEVILE